MKNLDINEIKNGFPEPQTGEIILPTGVVTISGKTFAFTPNSIYKIRRVRWYDKMNYPFVFGMILCLAISLIAWFGVIKLIEWIAR